MHLALANCWQLPQGIGTDAARSCRTEDPMQNNAAAPAATDTSLSAEATFEAFAQTLDQLAAKVRRSKRFLAGRDDEARRGLVAHAGKLIAIVSVVDRVAFDPEQIPGLELLAKVAEQVAIASGMTVVRVANGCKCRDCSAKPAAVLS